MYDNLSNSQGIYLLLLLLFSPWASLAKPQSGDRYGSGTLHSRQVLLRGSFPLLSPTFRRSHLRRQMPPHPHQRERL
jgi:hypothetical protein